MEAFEEKGFELIDNLVAIDELRQLKNEAARIEIKGGGIRNAEKKFPIVKHLVESEKLTSIASAYLAGAVRHVRSIVFVKSLANNWLVSWHQDKTVAVTKKFNDPGWGPWSLKDGVLHVQPPIDVLQQMITIRIHLDASTASNGCLKVMPGSHKEGVMSQEFIDQYSKTHCEIVCSAPEGSALLMRPHLLHASNKASNPGQRRVLHMEFSSYALPAGISWA